MAMQMFRFPDAAQAAQALAAAVAADVRHALTEQERALLLVSGGRSPRPFFGALTAQPLPWQQLDVSLVDERAVPFSHADSNARLVCKYLMRDAASSARWLPLVPVDAPEIIENAWDLACNCVAEANRTAAFSRPTAIVLGAGTDGHTASLFPDSAQWPSARVAPERYVAVQPGSAPHPRISLSFRALAEQGVCYLWTGGNEKLEVLNHVKMLADQYIKGRLEEEALYRAGPIAMLIAQENATLHVFHYDD